MVWLNRPLWNGLGACCGKLNASRSRRSENCWAAAQWAAINRSTARAQSATGAGLRRSSSTVGGLPKSSRPRQSRSRGARRSASSMRLLSSSSDNRTGVLAGTGPWTNPCLSGCSRLPTCSARNGGGPFGDSCGPIRDRLNVANGSLAGRLPAGRRIRGELYDRTADRQTVTVRSAPIAPQLSARARPGRFGQLEGCGMIA
jgi:hypothetical protein